MRVYLEKNVNEALDERIRYIISEFENVAATVSGGKDSGVVFHKTLEIAREMGETPIYCFWIDQEAEYQSTVEMIEHWMSMDDVEPLWAQIPFEITNGAGHEENEITVWNPDLDEDQWMRPKHDLSLKENTYGTRSLDGLFGSILDKEVDGSCAAIGGVRAEESPNRFLGLTGHNIYNGITYGRGSKYKGITTFYPIYDWTWSDVWKYTYENNLRYNDIYDFQHQEGVPIRQMRVSHLHHQQAVNNLFTLQKFEPETYNNLVDRVPGIHATATLDEEGILPQELPFMFESWREYRNYLTEKLIEDPEDRRKIKRKFFRHDLMSEHMSGYDSVCKGHVYAVLVNDVTDFDTLKDIRKSISHPRSQEIRDQKLEYLQNERPDVWNQLQKEGIV